MQKNNPQILYEQNGSFHTAMSDKCLHSKYGNTIDIQWNYKSGTMKVFASKNDQLDNTFKYINNKADKIQILRNVKFHHGQNCPLINQKVKKNKQRNMKPCACVLIYDKKNKKMLLTQRSYQLRTYPNAWVFPGGHLEADEGIFQGGIRQCNEQVGLPSNIKFNQVQTQNMVMAWQSVFINENQVKASALVLFFVVVCDHFQVKIQQKQVNSFKWKSIQDKQGQFKYSSQQKKGYAQGHLKFLQIVRQQILKYKNK